MNTKHRSRNTVKSWETLIFEIAESNRQWIRKKYKYDPKPKYPGYPEIILKEKTLDF